MQPEQTHGNVSKMSVAAAGRGGDIVGARSIWELAGGKLRWPHEGGDCRDGQNWVGHRTA